MTRKLRVVAVDDEALALRRIEILLSAIPDVELAGTAADGEEALELIERLRPHVVLLDVRMGEMSGFEVVERLAGPQAPLVIFTTAFDRYAIRAFKVSATDYLLKPIELDRMKAAFEKARWSLAAKEAEMRAAELLQIVEALREQDHTTETRRYDTELWATRRDEVVRVPVVELDWIEAERDYVRLHIGDQSYLLRETMLALQERLDPRKFVRIRRSALVRVDRITGIRRVSYGDFRVLLSSGGEVRVGRTYVKQIRHMISSRNLN